MLRKNIPVSHHSSKCWAMTAKWTMAAPIDRSATTTEAAPTAAVYLPEIPRRAGPAPDGGVRA